MKSEIISLTGNVMLQNDKSKSYCRIRKRFINGVKRKYQTLISISFIGSKSSIFCDEIVSIAQNLLHFHATQHSIKIQE